MYCNCKIVTVAVQTQPHALPIHSHFVGSSAAGKSENIPCFLVIRYIAVRAMAKNWLLKVGFKLKNCKRNMHFKFCF